MFNKNPSYHDSGEQMTASAPPEIKKSTQRNWQIILRNFFIATVIYGLLVQITNYVVDDAAGITKFLPPINLENIDKPPFGYDNIPRIRVKMTDTQRLRFEANKRFIFLVGNKNYTYSDSISVALPDSGVKLNRIYFKFEGSNSTDSMHLIVTKSEGGYYRQISYCSVEIYDVNNILPVDSMLFRINPNNLVGKDLLENNDPLINKAFLDFNLEYRVKPAGDCGTLSKNFKNICAAGYVPCRLVGVHGGDHFEPGFGNTVGFPIHLMCEIYSSKQKKWYVVDPLYGVRFRNPFSSEFMSAVEITNLYESKSQGGILLDSILASKVSPLPEDYYQFYDNIYYPTNYVANKIFKKIMDVFFGKYNYNFYHYAHSTTSFGGRSYLILKLAIYFILTIIYINFAYIFVVRKIFVPN